VSYSLIRQIERGDRETTRLATGRKLAVALGVPTSVLMTTGDADGPWEDTEVSWEPVRRALFTVQDDRDDGEPVPGPDEVEAAMLALQPALSANRYAEVAAVLPGLIVDAKSMTGNGIVRTRRAEVLNLTGWLMVQTRQWDAAEGALRMSIDAAGDKLTAAAAVNTISWLWLRQGRLDDARDLSLKWADDIEPRFSWATVAELSLWGRLYLTVANAAVRDNRPDEAEEALDLAALAGHRIGREILSDRSTTRTFGPWTVEMIRAESASISEQPDRTLAIARTIPPGAFLPVSASRCRHRLDVANALAQLRRQPQALAVLVGLRRDAPEWLVQQRYARDIVTGIIRRRRALSSELRELADFLRVPY
jgi:hypothetical protein